MTRAWARISCCLLGLYMLAGCPSAPPGGSTVSASDAERLASIEAVQDLVDRTLTGGDPDAQAGQLAATLRAMPDFAEVTVADECIFARYADGETLAIFNNRGSGTNPLAGESPETLTDGGIVIPDATNRTLRVITPEQFAMPDPRQAGTGARLLPQSTKAVLINTMGNSYVDSVPQIAAALTAAGYSVVQGTPGTPGTIEDLRNLVKDAGVFYLSSHGSPYKRADGSRGFLFWTRTPLTDANLATYRADVAAGKLEYAIAETDRAADGSIVRSRHFVITDQFVREHWRLSAGSFVYVDACSSGDDAIASVCQGSEVNAALYVGWSNPVLDQYSTPSVRYAFDRLLGANAYKPMSTFPRRPFAVRPVAETMAALRRLNLALDASLSPRALFLVFIEPPSQSKLVWKRQAGLDDILLRPSISNLTVSEFADTLNVFGDFGDTPGSVTLNGSPLTVTAGGWTASQIMCELPRSASGDVVVTVNGRPSNVRRLSKWDLTFRHHFADFPTLRSLNCPSCFYDLTLTYPLRADAAEYRGTPEAVPAAINYSGSSTADTSLAVNDVGGTYTINSGGVYNVVQTANPAVNAVAIGTCLGFMPLDEYVGSCFLLKESSRTIDFSPTFQANALLQTWTSNPAGGSLEGVYPTAVTYSGNLTNFTLPLQYDSGYAITDGRFDFGTMSYFEWESAAAQNPPEATMPR